MVTFRKILKLGGKRGYRVVEEEVKKGEREKLTAKFLAVTGLAFELGFAISIPIVGGAVFGAFLDRKFNLAPKMTLSFIFLGVFLAIGNLYRMVKLGSQRKHH